MGFHLLNPVCDDQPRPFLQPRSPWEKRGGVSIRPHPQKDQIEARDPARIELKKLSQCLLIGRCDFVRVRILRRNPEYVSRWYRNFREHRFVHHPVIALRIIGWHMPLISPEKEHAVPGKGRSSIGCEKVVKAFRSRSAG